MSSASFGLVELKLQDDGTYVMTSESHFAEPQTHEFCHEMWGADDQPDDVGLDWTEGESAYEDNDVFEEDECHAPQDVLVDLKWLRACALKSGASAVIVQDIDGWIRICERAAANGRRVVGMWIL